MGFLRHATNGFEFFFGMEKALVAPGNVVVDFNAEDTAVAGFLSNFRRVGGAEPVGSDASVMAPILARRVGLRVGSNDRAGR
jgi:hypothetical protein